MTRISNTINKTSVAVRAARDSGDVAGDRSRKLAVQDLVRQANSLLEAAPGGKYPEAEDAAKAVQGLHHLLEQVDSLNVQLRAAPAASEEASQYQRQLDGVRLMLDTMMLPLQASMTAMETLLMATLEIEEQFEHLQAQTHGFEENLKQAKARVAAIAAAVKSTAKIG
jgi:hypothetical protein